MASLKSKDTIEDRRHPSAIVVPQSEASQSPPPPRKQVLPVPPINLDIKKQGMISQKKEKTGSAVLSPKRDVTAAITEREPLSSARLQR